MMKETPGPQGQNQKEILEAKLYASQPQRRKTMKKQALMIVATVGFLIALSTVSAFAQTQDPITAKIPFEFSVNGKTLPAGTYTAGKMLSGGVVIVRSEDRKVVVTSIANVAASNKETATQLTFHRYGNQYFLAKIEIEGANGLELPKTKAERQAAKQADDRHLAKSGGAPEIVTVPASL
jgi:hypothetical protein